MSEFKIQHPLCFDARKRAEVISEVDDGEFDLVIVGGGINGAGTAHDAALRGLKVLLLEQRDLAFGTSSRSSKLIHGGLRYLEHYQFGLVFEGTNERAALRKIAPHLVRPLLFALPVYEGNRHPLWKMDIGLWLYDGLSLFKTEKRHITLRSSKRMLEREPLLRSEGLTGGIVYYDCMTDDARMTLENALAAAQRGAQVLTHAKVTQVDGLADDEAHHATVHFQDTRTGKTHRVRARGVVNCTGAWTDATRKLAALEGQLVRPSKGVHVVVPHERLPVKHAAALLAPQDGRVFFAIPWAGRTVLGTTDTDDDTDPSQLTANLEDTEYLLAAANYAFPTVNLSNDDILAAWVGLRPLIHVETDNASDVPREHQIVRDGKMVTIFGGKLTTYRRMAIELVDAAAEVIHANITESPSETEKLPGAVGIDQDFDDLGAALAQQYRVPDDVAMRLANVYGSRAEDVLQYLRDEPDLAERVCPDRDVIMAEMVHAVEREMGVTLDDLMVRRTSLSLTAADQGLGAAERVAAVMAARLGWDAETQKAEVEAFRASVALTRRFVEELEAGSEPAREVG